MESAETISVIIPTKNEGDTLEECLLSVFNQSISPFEAMIVDGGSTDNTLEIAKKFNVKIIIEGKSSSPASARNLGAENAKGTILLIMDADVTLQKDCLKYALDIFKEKNVICVIPSELNRNHSYLELVQRKWNEGLRTSINIGFQKANAPAYFFRREVFEKVKFNTAYGFGEDDDFSTRLENEFGSSEILVTTDCKVIAHLPHTIKELATRYIWWGRTSFSYLMKHFSFKSILNMGSLLLPMFVVFCFFASLLFPQARVLLISLFLLFIVKIFIICIRSRSAYFFQFTFFDAVRSFFFVVGFVQTPLFIRKKGR